MGVGVEDSEACAAAAAVAAFVQGWLPSPGEKDDNSEGNDAFSFGEGECDRDPAEEWIIYPAYIIQQIYDPIPKYTVTVDVMFGTPALPVEPFC